MRMVVAPWFAASPFLGLGADGEYSRSLLAQSGRRPWPGWRSGCDPWSPRSLRPFCLSDVRIRAGLGLAGEKKKETLAALIDKHREQIGGQIVTCPVLVPRLGPEAPPTVNSV